MRQSCCVSSCRCACAKALPLVAVRGVAMGPLGKRPSAGSRAGWWRRLPRSQNSRRCAARNPNHLWRTNTERNNVQHRHFRQMSSSDHSTQPSHDVVLVDVLCVTHCMSACSPALSNPAAAEGNLPVACTTRYVYVRKLLRCWVLAVHAQWYR